MTENISLEISAALSEVSPETRTIRGRIVSWGALGSTSAGPTVFATNSIAVPEDSRRVKLLIGHDANAPAVGYMRDIAIDSGGLSAGFHVPAGAAGDEALRLAAEGLRDGLSVGVSATKYRHDDAGVLHVTAGRLYEVSLVTIPAFENAAVTEVTASHQENGTTMPEEITAAETVVIEETPPVATPIAAAQAPAIIPPARPGTALDLRAASRIALAHLQAGEPPSMLRAALADLVPADDAGEGALRPQYLGELWSASLVERPIIDAIRRGTLQGLTVVGWQYDERFEVDTYAGNKTAIPSKKATTKAVTANAVRFAGGLDIDRVYIDLGAPGMVGDLFQQGTDSYRTETETYVVESLLAAATAIPAAASLTEFLVSVGVQAKTIGARLSFVTVSPDIWSTFAGLTSADVPWWLNNGDGGVNVGNPNGNAGGITFDVDTALDENTILAGDARAATWYEVNPPIRVRAENIPNGGIDIGVFGYGALIVNDARALFKGSITEAAPATVKSTSK